MTLLSPNPTSGNLQIQYSVARAGRVQLDLLDVSGRVVATLADGNHQPGRYAAAWEAAGRRGQLSPGLYFARLVAPDRVAMAKVALIR